MKMFYSRLSTAVAFAGFAVAGFAVAGFAVAGFAICQSPFAAGRHSPLVS
jgi:hypothetical protein